MVFMENIAINQTTICAILCVNRLNSLFSKVHWLMIKWLKPRSTQWLRLINDCVILRRTEKPAIQSLYMSTVFFTSFSSFSSFCFVFVSFEWLNRIEMTWVCNEFEFANIKTFMYLFRNPLILLFLGLYWGANIVLFIDENWFF